MEEKDYLQWIKGINRRKIIILLMSSYIKVLSSLDNLEKIVIKISKLHNRELPKNNSYFAGDIDKLLYSITENKKLITSLYYKTKENFVQNKTFL